MLEGLTTIAPADEVVFYLISLFLFHLLLWSLTTRFNFRKYDSTQLSTDQKPDKWLDFTNQIGFSIHGIYRVFAGAIPAAVIFLMKQ